MTTYNINPKTYSATPITSTKNTKITHQLNTPSSLTFDYDAKFDATSLVNLQNDVAITYNTSTLFSGKIKEEERNLGAEEQISYKAIGANLEEAYVTQMEGEISRRGATAIWTKGELYAYGLAGNNNRLIIKGDCHVLKSALFGGLKYNYIQGDIFCKGSFQFYDDWSDTEPPIYPDMIVTGNAYAPLHFLVYMQAMGTIGINVYTPFLNVVDIGAVLNISGNLYNTTKHITGGAVLNIGGTIEPYIMPEIERQPPIVDLTYYLNNVDPTYKFIGDTTLSGIYSPPNGIIYVDGDIYIDSDVVVKGCVISTGGFYLANSGTFIQSKVGVLPAIISLSEIDLEGMAQCEGLIYSENYCYISNNFNLLGSIIGQNPWEGVYFDPSNINYEMNIEGKDFSDVPGLTY